MARPETPDGLILDELVRVIVGGIVDVPDRIQTVVIESGNTVIIELSVAKEDLGKVIGREGSMANALRALLSNAATKLHRRSLLQIVE